MTTIKTQVHTIFMLVGPSESGKTTFAKKVLIPQLQFSDLYKNFHTNVQFISSDDIRRDILGQDYHKHSNTMLEASQGAFEILLAKLKAVTSFPVNAEFVIVDTTGLSQSFRDQVYDIAKENHYNMELIVFDFKDNKDYYNSEESKAIISQHVKRLKQKVLGEIKTEQSKRAYRTKSFKKPAEEKYTRIHRIRAKNFYDSLTNKANQDYKIVVEDMKKYVEHILPSNYKYFIVSDVHENVDELKKILSTKGMNVENGKIIKTEKNHYWKVILNGDWIDKGKQTKEMITFIYENLDWFILVKGNHEHFVHGALRKEIDYSKMDKNFLSEQFSSFEVFQQDEELKQKFFELFNLSKNHYRRIGVSDSSFCVTHAPCSDKYLGKIDKISKQKQRNFKVYQMEGSLQDKLSFLKEESVNNFPYHIFGHIACQEVIRLGNKLGIDTGCVYGNKLTGVNIENGKPHFVHVDSLNKNDENVQKLELLFERKKEDVKIHQLDEQDKRKLNYLLRNQVNFISGTMSPANKDVEANELESLKQGLLHFKNNNVSRVVLQRKYMGSRCTVYLHENLKDCFATSRNGYKIKHVEDLDKIFIDMKNKFMQHMQENNIQTLVLDGELLPWKVLGSGLIEKSFKVVEYGIASELSLLKETGYEDIVGNFINKYTNSEFAKDQNTMSKQGLIEKYGHAEYRHMKHGKDVINSYFPLEQQENAHNIYKEQLELYGNDGEIEFKPFNILKVVYKDGKEENHSEKMSASEIFKLISNDEFLVIDFNDSNFLEKAELFYDKLTQNERMEGVVIKPEFNKKGVAPYLKVRNKKYLTLVYGYDYLTPRKYGNFMGRKNISQKLKTSMQEFELGNQMLEYTQESINENNHEYKQLVANMIIELNKESGFDPRL